MNSGAGHEPGTIMRPLVRLGKDSDACWEWIGCKLQNGYGKKTFNGHTLLAHRWVWSQLFGPIPDGLVIDHICQNRGCVNPHHLRVVTQAENIRSAVTTLLTSGDVDEIRELNDAGWFADKIAERFDVATTTVKSILHGKSWRRRPRKFYGPHQRMRDETA